MFDGIQLLWETLPLWAKVSVSLAGTLLAVLYYKICWRPLNMARGIDQLYKKSARARAATKRDLGPLPPPYPDGWFRVLDTVDLKIGDARHVKAFGKHLAVFRGHSGAAHVLDAYCPHLGANLAHGGTVSGDSIRCPFHGWEFAGDGGQCTRIPYTEKSVPRSAATGCYEVREYNGSVMVWHHAMGEKPSWEPPVISRELSGGALRYHGRSVHHVEAHAQEIPENGADVAHLNVLHVPLIVEWIGNALGLTHHWTATWDKGGADAPHLAHIGLTQEVRWRSHRVPGTYIPVAITQVGPGMVHLHFDTPVGRLFVIEAVTALGPSLLQASHILFAESHVPRPFAKFVLRGLIVQFERDIPIWCNKKYVDKPLLVQGDGPIAKYRRWFQQFYSARNAKQQGNAASSNSSSATSDQLAW
jgi:cholesterol 7-desaturase